VKRLLLTGGSGYLGSHLLSAAQDWEVHTTYFAHPIPSPKAQAVQLDLHDEAATRRLVEELRPAVILHTACSNRSQQEMDAIVPAARALASAAREGGSHLIHLSTDLVFDGEHAPYHDDSPPTPLVPYGHLKAEAEQVVAALYPAALIVRPSLIWGLDPPDHQTGWMTTTLQRGERLTLFTDEYRCPIWVHDLCAALLELAERPDLSGPIHLVGPQALSRLEFGLKILRALNVASGDQVIANTVQASGLVRARNLTLTTQRATRELKTRLRAVDEVIA